MTSVVCNEQTTKRNRTLCYDEKYVHVSNEPDPILKGDYYFIAKQMGLRTVANDKLKSFYTS